MVLLESIHARYAERFTESNDVLGNDIGLRVLMQQSLREELDDQQASAKRSKAPVYWAAGITLLIILAGWQMWQQYQQRQFESRVVDLFRSQPGYIVSNSRRQDGVLLIEGLRDPGTPEPDTLLTTQGLPENGIQFRFKPFWSLEPTLVLQGLSTSLGLPDSTALALQGSTLVVTGELGQEQAERLANLTGVHPLISAIDLTGIGLNIQDMLQQVRLKLQAPSSVELTAVDGRILVSGYSDIAWYVEKSATPQVFDGWEVGFEPLLAELKNRLHADVDRMNKTVFFFARQDLLTPDSLTVLDRFAQQLSGLLQSSRELGVDLTITLAGQTDGTGTAEQNERMSRKRVKVVRDRLISSGIDSGLLQPEYAAWNSGSESLAQRRVSVRITGEEHP